MNKGILFNTIMQKVKVKDKQQICYILAKVLEETLEEDTENRIESTVFHKDKKKKLPGRNYLSKRIC